MPRDADIAARSNKTPQDDAPAPVGYVVGAQPVTQHNAIQGDKASMMANQLSEALGIGSKVASNAAEQNTTLNDTLGKTDAQLGVTDPTNKVYAYKAAQDHVHALASWEAISPGLIDQASKLGFSQNPDAKQGLIDQNNWLNEQFKQQWNGSSAATAQTLAPKMAELRNALNTRFQQDVLQQANAKQQADLKTVASGEFNNSFTPTIDPTTKQPFTNGGGSFDPSKFDYQKVNDLNRSLYPGGETNTLTLSHLSDLAITHGTPSLLTAMPDRWADGTPTPKGSGDPKVVAEYRRAVDSAEAQQKRNLEEADKATKDQNKVDFESAAKDTLSQIAGGKSFTRAEFDSKVGNLPGASYHDAITIWEQNQSYGTVQEKRSLEHLQTTEGLQEYGAKFNSIKSQVILGTPSFQSLPEVLSQIHQAGYSGVTADKMLAKLAPVVDAAGSNILKNPEDQAALAQIKSVYNPGNYSAIDKKFDNERNNAAQQAGLQAFHQSRASGASTADAIKAADAAASNAGKIYDDTQGKQGENTRSASQAYKDTAVTLIPTSDIRTALQKNDTATIRSMGLTPREIQRRMNSKELSPDEALALRNKLK